jgi:4-hydroxybenzoyl-CoA reductase subunit beta
MMRLPKFSYLVPQTVADAVRMMGDAGPEGQFVAGGTDLYPNMKRRQQTPRTVIAIGRLRELTHVEGDGQTGLRIGAGVTLTEIVEHPIVNRDYPAVAEAARLISTPTLRNMGTIGGNLLLDTRCNYYDQNFEWRRAINFCMKKDGEICWVAPGSPKCWAVQSSDLVPLMVAMGAELRLVSTVGDRLVNARGFYNNDGIDYLRKRPDELLAEIILPPAAGWRAVYKKLRRRGAFDFPVLGVAARVDLDHDGTVTAARVVMGGVSPAPLEVEGAGTALVGGRLEDESVRAAAEACYNRARPLDNTDHLMNYRKQMARPFSLRALEALRQTNA